MNRAVIALLIIPAAMNMHGQAQPPAQTQAQPATQTSDKGADSTQSFTSPFGLGTGATLSVTSKGTSVAASVERQLDSHALNFWQVGISGTMDKNGQTELFSSNDKDAPGFKGKFGIGKSSFIRKWAGYTASAGQVERQALCRDLLNIVNKSLKGPASVGADADCLTALGVVQTAYDTAPPGDSPTKKLDALILEELHDKVGRLTKATPQAPAGGDDATKAEQEMCDAFKKENANSAAFMLCPDSGANLKSPEDVKKTYPGLYSLLTAEPGKFQWKAWVSWAPAVTSVDYRAVTNGITDLATKLQWTQLLNTGLGDVALYYGSFAFGLEGGFGQTVTVSTQNVCNTATSGTYTSQSCDMAMIGKPNPTNAWMGSSALQVYPIPVLGKGTLFNPGIQVHFSYVAPATGGRSMELAVPFYLAPSASPIKLVFGLQPTWDWNSDPKIGNKFTIALFLGARPEPVK